MLFVEEFFLEICFFRGGGAEVASVASAYSRRGRWGRRPAGNERDAARSASSNICASLGNGAAEATTKGRGQTLSSFFELFFFF